MAQTVQCRKFEPGTDGVSGFVNNPDNQHFTIKIILPTQYTDKVKNLKIYTKKWKFREELYREEPNEYDNRMRYYGHHPIATYNKPIIVVAKLYKKFGRAKCWSVPNPLIRQD